MKLQKILLLVLAVALLAFCAISCDFSGSTESTGSANSNSASESVSESAGGSTESTSSTESGTTPAACEHEFADDFTCHDRTCTVCGEVVKATTAHTLADENTCHDRTCSVCGEVVKATTAHTLADENTCHDRTCSVCKEVVKATTAHTLADEYTCHDRTCTVCGEVVKATTEHTYGEWTVVTEATCLVNGEDERVCVCGAKETRTTVGKHDFNSEGVCNYCNQNIKKLFMTPDGSTSVVSVKEKLGVYEISSTAANYDAYTVISGEILEALKELGYKTLKITVKNPGQAVAEDWKHFMMAAESKDNLWKEETAIALITPTQIFDGGNKYTFTFNVETYAGKDVYIYVDKCKNYPTVVEIAEFFDYEAPEAMISDSTNGKVEYIEGKGWHLYASDTSQAGYYANISGDVLKHYIDKGNVTLKVSFVNTFELDGVVTAGNSVNCQMQFLPKRVSDGGEQWGYVSNFISQLNQAQDGSYFATVDLTDSTCDFSKGMRIYMVMKDVGGASVGHTYISKIEFLNYTHKSLWLTATKDDNANVAYIEGKGWKIERKNKGKEWYCRIPAKYMSGNSAMKINYINQLEGVANVNTGNFVSTKSRIIPWKAGGSEDWRYQNMKISEHPKNADGSYTSTVDLTDSAYDFTKDTRICFENVGDSVSCGYISEIEFIK